MSQPSKLSRFFELALDAKVLFRSVKIALTVGSIYNLINQGDILLSGQFENLNYIKLTLTYMTPFFVSTYAATMAKMQMEEGMV